MLLLNSFESPISNLIIAFESPAGRNFEIWQHNEIDSHQFVHKKNRGAVPPVYPSTFKNFMVLK